MHAFCTPIGDTLRKAYHEECQQIGEDSKCSRRESNDSQKQDNKEAGQQRLGTDPSCRNSE